MDIFGIVVRLVLVILSIASFLPQLQLIRTKRDCTGISLLYLLSNLIVTTYHFSLALQFVVIDWEGRFVVNQPPDLRDWLNLIQFLVVWLWQLLLFSLALALPPQRKALKAKVVVAHLAFLSITLVPTILLASETKDERGWDSALLAGGLIYIVAPFVQFMGLVALWAQARETIAQHGRGSLSIDGLFIQAFVFLLVGSSFIFRLKLPAEEWNYYLPNALRSWYWLVGWATLNNLIFALSQGILGWISLRQKRGIGGELEQLLG